MNSLSNNIFIISELHPQHGGDINRLETMILQSKMGGADAVKVQLYLSKSLFGDERKKHLEISYDELKDIKKYCDNIGIDLFASVFDFDRLEWCRELKFNFYKIASKIFSNEDLCRKIMNTGKTVFVSNGFHLGDFRYDANNIHYFYCVPEYPAGLDKIKHPDYRSSKYKGYSDHSMGVTAAIVAITKGAKFIEKHYSLSCALQSDNEKGHAGSMNIDMLKQIRSFANEFVLMK